MTAATRARVPAKRPTFDLFAPIWRTLTSVRFAVLFIATLAAFGLLGVLIPQIPEAMRGNRAAVDTWVEVQRGTFGPFTEPMYRLGLFSIFRAKWFLAALAFLVVNVTVCTFNRWSPTFRNVFRPTKRVPDSFFDRAHNRAVLAHAAPERVDAALRNMHFRTETTTENGATYIFADRYPWTQLSTFVSHLALILFIAGGLVTSLTGFTSDMFAGEGTTVPVFAVKDPNQLQVRIDDAVGVYGERGNALDFRTQLTIFKNGEEVKSGTVTVNNPLEYDGYRFHQVAYLRDGVELRIRDVATGNTVLNETFALENSTATARVTIRDTSGAVFFSDVIAPTDFIGDANGTLVRASDDGRILWIGLAPVGSKRWQVVAFDPSRAVDGPIRIDEGGTAAFGDATIRFDSVEALPASVGIGAPDGDGRLLAQLVSTNDGAESLMLVGTDRPAISLAENDPTVVGGYEYTYEGIREFSGISVKRDSGAWFIWIATSMLVIGLAVTFYVPRRRLWLRLTGESTQIAALAEKSGGFEKDMRTLANRMGVPVPPELEEEP